MDKWEYLVCYGSGDIFHLLTDIPLEKFQADLPDFQVTINTERKSVMVHRKKSEQLDDKGRTLIRLFNCLGDQGWEAYAAVEDSVDYTQYFKRKKLT
jgi:hypothetical protein